MRERNHDDECTNPLDDSHLERGEQCMKKRRRKAPNQISVRGETYEKIAANAKQAGISIASYVDKIIALGLEGAP